MAKFRGLKIAWFTTITLTLYSLKYDIYIHHNALYIFFENDQATNLFDK